MRLIKKAPIGAEFNGGFIGLAKAGASRVDIARREVLQKKNKQTVSVFARLS